ncbi:MAG: hypothetical protein RR409_17910 [Clostridium sp.]
MEFKVRKLIKVFWVCSIVFILFTGCSVGKSTQGTINDNNNVGNDKGSETQIDKSKNNKELTSDEALKIASKSFGADMQYKYLSKTKINELEYYQFSWGKDGKESDSRVCIDVKTGKPYLEYADGKFVDLETYLKNAKLNSAK